MAGLLGRVQHLVSLAGLLIRPATSLHMHSYGIPVLSGTGPGGAIGPGATRSDTNGGNFGNGRFGTSKFGTSMDGSLSWNRVFPVCANFRQAGQTTAQGGESAAFPGGRTRQ